MGVWNHLFRHKWTIIVNQKYLSTSKLLVSKLWQLKSKVLDEWFLNPQWAIDLSWDASFSGPDLHQKWSNLHGIFFVYTSNFLLYLNKIRNKTHRHRITPKHGYFAANRQICFCVISIATRVMLCWCRESIS